MSWATLVGRDVGDRHIQYRRRLLHYMCRVVVHPGRPEMSAQCPYWGAIATYSLRVFASWYISRMAGW